MEDEADMTGKEKDGWVSLHEFRVFGKELLTADAAADVPAQKGVEKTVADFLSFLSLYPNPARGAVRGSVFG